MAFQTTGYGTEVTPLQEIKEEDSKKSSQIEPGSFHLRNDVINAKKQNQLIQKHIPKEPGTPTNERYRKSSSVDKRSQSYEDLFKAKNDLIQKKLEKEMKRKKRMKSLR